MDNEVVLYAVIPLLWVVSSVAAVIFALAWLFKTDKRKAKRRCFVSVACAAGTIAIMGTYPTEGSSALEPKTVKKAAEEPKREKKAKPEPKNPKSEPEILGFLDDFTKYGYSPEQIADMKTVLANVGITEVKKLEIGSVSYGMQVVKGVAFQGKSLRGPRDDVEVQFNIENGVIYYVHIYCPWDNVDGLEDRRAELYYDTDGGYLKKIDWKNREVVDMEG